MTRRNVLLAIAVLCASSVALALIAQHQFGMKPCPWCILQRLIYVVIALVAFVGLVRPLRVPAAILVFLLSLGGIAAALHQHFVASKSNSCALTFADTIVAHTGLDRLAPAWFEATANCAEAAVKVLGVSFDIWSLLLYCVVAVCAVVALRLR
jgi:disulfide bond formation protein DsbB